MGVKRKCLEINRAKTQFLHWLKQSKAEYIDVYEGESTGDDGWDYYRHVSAFVGDTLYNVYFMMWDGFVKIDYSDGDNSYEAMTIKEFNQLLF